MALRLLPELSGPLLAMFTVTGCIELDPFACSDDAQCVSAEGGRCHDNGHCSYPDPQCGRRWSEFAGSLAGQCVDDPVAGTGSSSGSSDAGGSAGSAGATSTTEATTSTAGSCGDGELADDEVCDDGNSVDGDGCNTDCQPSGRILYSRTPQVHAFDNELGGVAVDSQGVVVAAGYTSSEAADSETDSNQYDPLVVRYDLEGEELAVWTESNPGRDQLRCVTVAGGRVVVAGERNEPTLGAELWVAQVDTDASLTTLHAFGQTHSAQTVAQGCTASQQGDLAIAGMIDGDLGDGYEAWDRFIVFQPGGPQSWDTILPAPVVLRDVAHAIAVPRPGVVIAAGSTAVTEDTASDRWAARFDAEGQPSGWQYINGGPGSGHEEVLDVAVVDDVVYLVGITAINAGNVEAEWVGALGLDDGILRWEDDLAIDESARVNAVAVDDQGMLVMVGEIFEDGGGSRAYAAKFDPSARIVTWLNDDLGGARASDVTVAPDNTIIVVGSTVVRSQNGPALLVRLAP